MTQDMYWVWIERTPTFVLSRKRTRRQTKWKIHALPVWINSGLSCGSF